MEQIMTNELCPLCGATVLEMYGCGWDVDRLICSTRGCEYEKELKTMTYIEEAKAKDPQSLF